MQYKKILATFTLVTTCFTIYGQNFFSLGIGLGPAMTFTSLSNEHKNIKPQFPTRINFHLGITAQYLFDNKFGVESGFNISTKTIKVKNKDAGANYIVVLDSYAFPFLLNAKLKYPSNPYRALNFLAGTTIEYQNFIKNSGMLSRPYRANSFVPNLTLGSRISFKPGVLGRLDLGATLNFALKPYHAYRVENTGNNVDLTISPVAHFLKFEIFYFFINSGG